jgi:lycopene beta-cyclase
MDFNVDQFNDCRFVYTIPLSSTRALVEYTGFSPNLISDEEYDNELVKYIQNQQNITSYKILETEKGQIPMVESEFVNPYGNRVVNIGTAGGSSKPSTGYTFYFIQKQVQDIVQQLLLQKKQLQIPKRNARFLLYDKVLLEVLNKKQLSAQAVFTDLFKNNKITHLLAFLNEESTLVQDIQIMNSVPKTHFIKAFFKKIIN